MPRRPAGMRVMSGAERQRLYRKRRRMLPPDCEEIVPGRLSRRALIQGQSRPRPPGAEGLAQAAAETLIEFARETRRAQEAQREAWREACTRVAKAILPPAKGGPANGPRKAAQVLLRHAIEDELAFDDDMPATAVWGTSYHSVHRGRR